MADQTVVYLFTGRAVKQDWFENMPGGLTLAKDGKAALIETLNEYPYRLAPEAGPKWFFLIRQATPYPIAPTIRSQALQDPERQCGVLLPVF
ncbi:MAG: hypothetical protein E8D45_09675 [Nitrospira sp.]|nr:MAG: hypothetical protein E8D45_09675 [Nitrospira sp.]